MTKLCKDFGFGELNGSNILYFEKPDDNDTILDESGQRRHRQLLCRLLWLDRLDIKNAVCQLSTHVGTATTRDEINIKRLLRYLVGNPACNMIVGCNLDVLGIAGIPQGSVVVMTDADRVGDVKDRRGIAVWVKGTDSSAALGFVKRKGASRRTRHVDTKVYFMHAWAMEPGQRILKIHCDSHQVADCKNHNSSSSSSQSSWTMTDAEIFLTSMRGAEDRCPPNRCI